MNACLMAMTIQVQDGFMSANNTVLPADASAENCCASVPRTRSISLDRVPDPLLLLRSRALCPKPPAALVYVPITERLLRVAGS